MLNDSSNEKSKFATKKWHVIDSQTTKGDDIKFQTETIKSSIFDYSDTFILVTGNITVTLTMIKMLRLKIVHHFLRAEQ